MISQWQQVCVLVDRIKILPVEKVTNDLFIFSPYLQDYIQFDWFSDKTKWTTKHFILKNKYSKTKQVGMYSATQPGERTTMRI